MVIYSIKSALCFAGDVLIQISENQRRLTSELEGVVCYLLSTRLLSCVFIDIKQCLIVFMAKPMFDQSLCVCVCDVVSLVSL